MSSKWWTHSWNPVIGCTPASPGCDNCYAKALHDQRHAAFVAGSRIPACYAQPFGQVTCLEERLARPLGWKKPRRVFVNSMSDLFHPDVPFEFLDRVFAVMALRPQHTFIICTKRPEMMREYLSRHDQQGWQGLIMDAAWDVFTDEEGECHTPRSVEGIWGKWEEISWPLPNVWLGVTAENQEQADARIPILLDTPAAKRFVSVEPMLGPVDLGCIPWPKAWRRPSDDLSDGFDALRYRNVRLPGATTFDWVICGGESGPGARPMHPDWARNLRDQCAAAGVPFFFKQWGGWMPLYDGAGREHMSRVGSRRAGRLLDGVEHNAIPEVLHA